MTTLRFCLWRLFVTNVPSSFCDFSKLLLIVTGIAFLLLSGCAKPQPAPPPIVQKKSKGEEIVANAKKELGVKYSYGGESPQAGFDCSGLVHWVYKQSGIELPRTTRQQLRVGTAIGKKEELKLGDIVTFKISWRRGYHTAIYIGDDKFIHSPKPKKHVRIESLKSSYWSKRYLGARRVIE